MLALFPGPAQLSGSDEKLAGARVRGYVDATQMQPSVSNLPLEGMSLKQLLRTPGAHTLYLLRH